MELLGPRQMFSNDILEPGRTYTFSFDNGRIFEWRSDTWVLNQLRSDLAGIAEIVSVKRPLFSDRYLVALIPILTFKVYEWDKVFQNTWFRLGYEHTTMISVYGGRSTPDTGGISEGLVGPLSDGLADTISTIAKPLTPILMAVAAGLIIHYIVKARR